MKPKLKIVTPEDTLPTRDYRDWLKFNRKSLDWKQIERTIHEPGDIVIMNPALERWRAR